MPRRTKSTSYWKTLGILASVLLVLNVVFVNAYVAVMTPQNWVERTAPALIAALLLTTITILFVFLSTIWLRRRVESGLWQIPLLAFAATVAGWVIIGLTVGDWLLPLYAVYGVAAGLISSGAFMIRGKLRTSKDKRLRDHFTDAELDQR